MTQMADNASSKMALIAASFQQDTAQSRKLLIENSKGIQDDMKLFLKECQRIKDACTDKVLAKQLSQAMESIETLSQQLKIVAAVKAAHPKDPDSEKQLILCSTNLMNAVKRALAASEAASIRAFRTTATSALAIVKFRKKLYTNSPVTKKTAAALK